MDKGLDAHLSPVPAVPGNPARRVAVLGYHKIGPPPVGGWETWYYIPTKTFRSHLERLAGVGWRFIDLDLFLKGLADPNCLPERAALVTFDDGYRSVLENAGPELIRAQCPAVMFVPTKYI